MADGSINPTEFEVTVYKSSERKSVATPLICHVILEED
jgi:hypothetical protein